MGYQIGHNSSLKNKWGIFVDLINSTTLNSLAAFTTTPLPPVKIQ
jgi:hypothetical protein